MEPTEFSEVMGLGFRLQYKSSQMHLGMAYPEIASHSMELGENVAG